MKKNNMFRIASVLLVAVLLSTCAISGAFAKYYTDGSATDSARVAAFGITVDADDAAAFGTKYNAGTDNGTVNTTAQKGDDAISVFATTDVIAPGTKGSLAGFTVSGTAEVDVTVAVTGELTLTNWELEDDTIYCPIVISVGEETFDFSTCTDEIAFETMIAAVNTEIAKYHQTIKAGNAASFKEGFSVSWAWAYEITGTEDAIKAADKKDTYLAQQAADDDDTNNPTISLTVTATVTQID